MKKSIKIFVVCCLLFFGGKLSAQTVSYANPVEYMNELFLHLDKVQADAWEYTKAVSHSRNARKIEKKRAEIIATIKASKGAVWKMPGYKGDKSLKDSAYSYLQISYNVMTEDYGKLVNLEEVAEQSFDAMEAYLLAQELANAKLDTSLLTLNMAYKAFAVKHNVTLNPVRDKIAENLMISEKVIKYYHRVYLVFFKAYKQELYVMNALNNSDMSGLKQNIDALKKVSNEGLSQMDTMKVYGADGTLKMACKEALKFYKNEAEVRLKTISDFLATKEKFEKVKKSLDAKPSGSRTQADIDGYNKAVNDYNTASQEVNNVINAINADRQKVLANWENAAITFIDKHVPKSN